MSYKSFLISGLLSCLSIAVAKPLRAATLDLVSWTLLGDVEILNASQANLSTDASLSGDNQGDDSDIGADPGEFNYSGNRAAKIADLESLLNLPPFSLDRPDSVFGAIEGSALQQKILVNRGERLSFEWNFLTNETRSQPNFPPKNDYGFLLVNQEIKQILDVNDTSKSSTETNFNTETGTRTDEYIFTSSGEKTIAFGVVDTDDALISSALLVNNLQIIKAPVQPSSVPESNSILGLLTMVALGAILSYQP